MDKTGLNHWAELTRAMIGYLYPLDREYNLGQQQRRFSLMVSALIQKAYGLGYEVSLGDAWAHHEDGRHKKNSHHYIRLAIDINLFKDGKYLKETSDHEELGDFWKSMGGTWGGDFRSPDGNHYSFGE